MLQVGRIESPLSMLARPWEVGLVAFEITPRHRFHENMSSLPGNVQVHVLPTAVTVRRPHWRSSGTGTV